MSSRTRRTRRVKGEISKPIRRLGVVVEVWSGLLVCSFIFRNRGNAEAFIQAGSRSLSIDGLALKINGKFAGARDGGS